MTYFPEEKNFQLHDSEYCTITTTLRHFSSCDGQDLVSTEYEYDGDRFHKYFIPTFYANGSCTENEGHVSIVLNILDADYKAIYERTITFSCTVSVIDAFGNKRYPQSFGAHYDYCPKENIPHKGFGIDKLIERSTLLSHSSELLPSDSLTLRLEIDFKHVMSRLAGYYGEGDLLYENDKCHLRMDSKMARELCKMSPVFQRMMECPMVEKIAGCVTVPLDELYSFLIMFHFLHGANFRESLSGICKLYVHADKYDMQQTIHLCHELLTSVMLAVNSEEILEYVDKDIHLMSELSDTFEGDERLREILKIYSAVKKEFEDGIKASNSKILETEWSCKIKKETFGLFFQYRKPQSEYLQMDFYR